MLSGMTEAETQELERLREENRRLQEQLAQAAADQEARSAESRYRAEIFPE